MSESNKIIFAKVRPDAIIPTKRDEDAAFDIYANFDEDYIAIPPHTTVLIPTGIASACEKHLCFILKERGSTGTKGIAQRSGVIDSGYRGEWMSPLTNTTNKTLFVSKLSPEETVKSYYHDVIYDDIFFVQIRDEDAIEEIIEEYLDLSIVYPYTKAISQAMVAIVPEVTVKTMQYDELQKIKSERGQGMLGRSGK